MGMVIRAEDFKTLARDLRRQAPELSRRMRTKINVAGRAATTRMRQRVPHPNSGASKHVKWSSALGVANGGAIVINGLAYTFGVGQPGRNGTYKHPVFGRWSSSTKTIMAVTGWVDDGWAEVGTALMLSADEAILETLEALRGASSA